MRKIPTLFKRDPEDMRHLLTEVNPECQWVLDGEGEATRKIDGTCVMFDGIIWWARREVKPGKPQPPSYREVETDPVTGKTVGWEPIAQSPFRKMWEEALRWTDGDPEHAEPRVYEPGTYELVGPKINGNPENAPAHMLVSHNATARVKPFGLDYDGIRATVQVLAAEGWEGIVWHHPDGRMAKIKARDFQ